MKTQRRLKQWLKNTTVYLCIVGSLVLYPGQLMKAQQASFVYTPGFNLSSTSSDGFTASLKALYGVDATGKSNVLIRDAENPYDSDSAYSIANQTSNIKATVGSAPSGLILVGQSQGGVRARTFLQLQATPAQEAGIRGLATISSPNKGGPVFTQGFGVLIRESAILAGFTRIPGLDRIVPTALLDTILYVHTNFLRESYTPGITDMKVGSSLLNSLNNPTNGQAVSQRKCYWKTYYETKRFMWWTYKQARQVQICETVQIPTADNRIPANVKVMSIVSGNSSADAMMNSLSGGKFNATTRIGLATVFSLWTGIFFATGFLPFQWWAFAVSATCFGIVQFLWRFPGIYNEAIGSNSHDGLFPTSRQVVPVSAGGKGGNLRRDIPNALHDFGYSSTSGGALGSYPMDIARALKDLEEAAK
jgi:hypothetical protein